MKRRFVFSIGLVITLAMLSIGIIQFFLFRSERNRLIDGRIESTASLLATSDLSHSELRDFEEAQATIEAMIGGESYNQFVIVTDRKGNVIYRSPSANELLPEKIPTDQRWQNYEGEGHIVRILTLDMGNRILQTGLALDVDSLRLRDLNRLVISFSVIFLVVSLLATMGLARVLLRPLNDLANYLRYLSSNFEQSLLLGKAAEPIPPKLIRSGGDEFAKLVSEVQGFSQKVSQGLRRTQIWTAQLAHEFNTPLTVLATRLQKIEGQIKDIKALETIDAAKKEIKQLSELVIEFLEWSQVENLPVGTEDLHAIKLRKHITEYVEHYRSGLAEKDQNRLMIDIDEKVDSSATIFAHQRFFEHVIANLLNNALKYSQPGSVVTINVESSGFRVIDSGPGLPEDVIHHLGQPFNAGGGVKQGHGLGLAWVATVCKRYGWKLVIERTSDNRTVATVRWGVEPGLNAQA